MQTKSLLKKGLAVGIIVVLSISSFPILGSTHVGKYKIIQNLTTEPYSVQAIDSRDINVTISGEMGNNGWFVSSVVITITGEGINHTYYSFDNQTWTEYTAPICITTDGIYELYVYCMNSDGEYQYFGPFPFKIDQTPPITSYNFSGNRLVLYAYDNTSGVNHTYYKLHAADPWTEYTGPVTFALDGIYELYFYSVDKAGNVEEVKGPFCLKVDKTPPSISLSVTPENLLKTKWLLNATVADATSGVAKVEFYIDDALVDNATTAPYFYIYRGKGKTAWAIAYDMAGNSASSPIMTPYTQNQGNSIVRQIIILLRNLIDNLLFHHQMKGWNR